MSTIPRRGARFDMLRVMQSNAALTGVMLQQLVHTHVPHFYSRVSAGRGNARAAGVKFDVINVAATHAQSDMFRFTFTERNVSYTPILSQSCRRNAHTNPACSKKVCTHSLLFVSHNFIVLSSLPLTMRRPSGENLIDG